MITFSLYGWSTFWLFDFCGIHAHPEIKFLLYFFVSYRENLVSKDSLYWKNTFESIQDPKERYSSQILDGVSVWKPFSPVKSHINKVLRKVPLRVHVIPSVSLFFFPISHDFNIFFAFFTNSSTITWISCYQVLVII